MSSYYSYYKSNNKPTIRTNNNEKEVLVRKLEQLDALERKRQYSTNNNNSIYKTAFLLICGGLIVGLGVLIYSVGYKLGKGKCKYKKYSS